MFYYDRLITIFNHILGLLHVNDHTTEDKMIPFDMIAISFLHPENVAERR